MSEFWKNISDFLDHNPDLPDSRVEEILIVHLHVHLASIPGASTALATRGLLSDLPRLQALCSQVAGSTEVTLRWTAGGAAWQATMDGGAGGHAGYGVGPTPGIAMMAALAALMLNQGAMA